MKVIKKIFLYIFRLDSKKKTLGYKNPTSEVMLENEVTLEWRWRTIGAKIQKNNFKNFTPGDTKISLNATKIII
jgi:hypothetical protein